MKIVIKGGGILSWLEIGGEKINHKCKECGFDEAILTIDKEGRKTYKCRDCGTITMIENRR